MAENIWFYNIQQVVSYTKCTIVMMLSLRYDMIRYINMRPNVYCPLKWSLPINFLEEFDTFMFSILPWLVRRIWKERVLLKYVSNCALLFYLFLGRLFDRVDLIKPVSNVRPSTKSFFNLYKMWRVGRGRWLMPMVCSMTWSKVKVSITNPSKLEIRPFSKAVSAIYNGSWQLPTVS